MNRIELPERQATKPGADDKPASDRDPGSVSATEPGDVGTSDGQAGHRVRVLIVDDEPAVRRTLARVLMARGYDMLTAENGEVALALLGSGNVDVMLLDIMMPNMDGLQVLDATKRHYPDVEVIMMTGHGDVAKAVQSVKGGAYDFLTKPFQSNDAVVLAVSKAAEHKRLIDKTRRLEQRLEHLKQFGELVGNSPVMRQVYRLALGVAPTMTSVLILGESGTGKELVARAIHQHSPRAGRPFVAVNCSAIPTELVESELFGHVRGAFTGAMLSRAGLFETADRGTLFLDEVGDLTPAAQVKLLRALQSGEIKRVGSDETRMVDVRVIAATNVDLKKKVTEGQFREDLYYRLNVIAIHLPALRKRRDDIPLLAYHFVHKYAKRLSRDVKRISPEAMKLLKEQSWKGNVRELENAIEHAVVLARSDAIVPSDLPFVRAERGPSAFSEPPPPGGAAPFCLPSNLADLPFPEAKKRAIEAFERSYVEIMLQRTGGNISEAARQCGLDRSNFRRVLKKGSPEGSG